MTDQTIPADDLRRFITRYRAAVNDQGSILLDELEALLPPPPRPTLVDMTDEERDACKWMQADVANHSVRYVIVDPDDGDGEAALVSADGVIFWAPSDRVTPRPDLPRLEWPGDKKPAPALPDGWKLADHKERGRVIVTTDTPNAAGDVCYVLPADDPLGYDWLFCDPSELTYIDTGQEASQ